MQICLSIASEMEYLFHNARAAILPAGRSFRGASCQQNRLM